MIVVPIMGPVAHTMVPEVATIELVIPAPVGILNPALLKVEFEKEPPDPAGNQENPAASDLGEEDLENNVQKTT